MDDAPLDSFSDPATDSDCATVAAPPDVVVRVEPPSETTAEWGQAAEADSPTPEECRRETRSLAPEPESFTDALQAKEVPCVFMQSLEARLNDLDQAMVRYGILFDQAVQRLDGQLQAITRQQAQGARAQEELKRTMRALATIIGQEQVNEVVQQQSVQNPGGARHFGRQRDDVLPQRQPEHSAGPRQGEFAGPRQAEHGAGPRQGEFAGPRQGEFAGPRQAEHGAGQRQGEFAGPRQGEYQHHRQPYVPREEYAGDGQWNAPRYRRGGGRRGGGAR